MEFYIFEGVDEKIVKKINRELPKPVKAEKGENIYRSGSIGILLSGSGKIIRSTEGGSSVTVRGISEGEIFGAASLFGEWNSSLSSIIALENVKVRYISEEEFRKLIQNYPQIALNYITYLSDRIRFLNKRMDTFSAGNIDRKLYEYLLSSADEKGRVTLNIGMAELARRLKIGRSSLYRCMEHLENSGLLQKEGKGFIIR